MSVTSNKTRITFCLVFLAGPKKILIRLKPLKDIIKENNSQKIL